jgi:etoposide-induced 2.4 mRNA
MEHINGLLLGVSHSLNYFSAGKVILNCRMLWEPVTYSFLTTGVVFLGSLLTYTHMIAPILMMISPRLLEVVNLLYYLLWVFPVYIVSFVLNSFWYGDIAEEAYKHLGYTKKVPKMNFTKRMAYEIHRSLLALIYLVIASLLSMVPAGSWLAIAMLSWLYSFYCWEFRWSLNGLTVFKQ